MYSSKLSQAQESDGSSLQQEPSVLLCVLKFAILLQLLATMVTIIIAPCNVAADQTSALKQMLCTTQRNNTLVSGQYQEVDKGWASTNINKSRFRPTISSLTISAYNAKR